MFSVPIRESLSVERTLGRPKQVIDPSLWLIRPRILGSAQHETPFLSHDNGSWAEMDCETDALSSQTVELAGA